MRILILLFGLLSLNCCRLGRADLPFWKAQKGKFKYHNKTEFVGDSISRNECKSLRKMRHGLFDSIFYSSDVYLYSWQKRNTATTEFTVIKDDGELGLKLFYFILDKNDKLIAVKQIAGKGVEAFYWFETRSKFISRDTMLHIGAITKWYDHDKMQKLDQTIGDTTFLYIVIDTLGQLTEKVFKEVKALDFENEEGY